MDALLQDGGAILQGEGQGIGSIAADRRPCFTSDLWSVLLHRRILLIPPCCSKAGSRPRTDRGDNFLGGEGGLGSGRR
jgi:hypothetical protein